MKRLILVALLASTVLLGASNTCLAVSGAGAINLVFPIGARYAAMGEAGIGLSQDATAIWWNPGGLAFLSDRTDHQRDLHIMQSNLAAGLADDIALYWGGYAAPWGPSGIFGASLNYLSMGTQEGTNEVGEPTETFSSYMFAISAVYGVKLTPNLGVGLGIKYFRDRLAPDAVLQDNQGGSGDSFGVDMGVLWKIPSMRMNFAAALSNLGPNIKHVDADQSDPMPRKMTVGIAYSLFHSEASALLFVADYLVPLLNWDTGNQDYGFGAEFDEEEFGLGAEWSYVQSLFFRFGYKSAQAGDIEDTTWGFGLDLQRWVNQGITFDYASVPQATGLDRVNRLSIGFRF
ncbi:MAG: PorV/PorQ family protein [bacterium]